jgi:hypothetical protein
VVVKEKVAEVFSATGEKLFEVVFADDASAAGKLEVVLAWVQALMEEGPKYGYHPEPSKSVLVVKAGLEERAKVVFKDFPGLEIVSHHKFLGGCLGAREGVLEWVEQQVDTWVKCVQHLARAARKFPQSAYVAFTTSLQSEWKYLQRLIPDSSACFEKLDQVIKHEFIPALLGKKFFTKAEMELFELPARWGGAWHP